MSKPKPRASEPAPSSRVPTVPTVPIPPTARKSSQPAINAQTAGATPRFYDGPTVSTQANDVKDKAKRAASRTSAVAKSSTKKAVATARRHPWSILSIISTLPALIFFSLASTVLCPPSSGSPSPFNKYVLSPLGYAPEQSHPLLCYPANVYHREILQPYVYPVIDKAQDRFTTSPYYVNYAKPTVQKADIISRRIWNGPLKPVTDRIIRGAKRFYFTFVQPHIPYLKAKYYSITAPYTSRFSAFAEPHIKTANTYANLASDRAVKGYNYASTHPVTGKAGELAKKGYLIGSEKGYKAYLWSKPHVLRARLEIERITRDILGPRAIKALERASVEVTKIELAVRSYVIKLYYSHLEPHVGPYVNRASTAIAPYTALFHKHVHQPYIQPAVQQFFPASVENKSFLTMLSEFLPTTGSSHAAEKKGQMDDFYDDLEHSRKPADVKVPAADKVAEKKKSPDAVTGNKEKKERKTQEKFEKSQAERVREAIKSRVDEQGKKSNQKVKQEIKRINEDFKSEQLPVLAQNLRSEVEREIDYILTGLDKLYTTSTSLKTDQVQKSSEQADARLKKTIEKIKVRLDAQKDKIRDQGVKVVKRESDSLDKALGVEYKELSEQMAYIDDISVKDWDKYNDVKKLADKYKINFNTVAQDTTLAKSFSELKTELNDFHESFRERIGILKRTALDRIKARQAMSAEPSRVSILPIKEAAGAAAAVAGVGAGGVLGKGKEQVLSALSAAGGVTSSSSGVVDQAKASAESLLNAASSNVHDATRSAISAVGATPSPESPREHIESVVNVASEGIESFLDDATSSVHQATRSAMKAVGVTPSPESIPEHAESAYSAAAEAVQSLSSAAESVVHDATKSVISAVGGTPSPESPREHAESIYNAASEVINSAVSGASEVVHQGTRSVISAVGATPSPETFSESIESVLAAASQGINDIIPDVDLSESVHQATRSAIKAVGGTPSPETPREHVESVYSVASESASSVVLIATEAVSQLAQDASSVIHEATRSASSAIGATPSPESSNEYLESIANVVAGGAASVYGAAGENFNAAYDAASSNVHEATRSIVKAVGGTPLPESPQEHLESIYDKASSVIATDAVDQITNLANQIQSAIGIQPTPSQPLASSASSYLASLASAGSSAGSEAFASGSSILSSLQIEASSTVSSVTREASKALGATPSPETPGEYYEAAKEAVQEKIRSPREIAESLVKKHASQIDRDLAEERARGTTRNIGNEHGHGHGHAHTQVHEEL
ncbi:uncharacterized protein IL334_005698 [Kwoniella shivajii]|uniref:Uncharacterized protein n=1 Tax=Kwoniella shivajii TaxID=564305 RepID=A0ABZ1D460_9TREE|nr:hypothetical protein IL334_005698 [Kwoniella shivajii]